jgi:hypothetical protein
VGENTQHSSKRGALRGGGAGRKHLLEQAKISNKEVAAIFDPVKLVYQVKSSSRTNIGG